MYQIEDGDFTEIELELVKRNRKEGEKTGPDQNYSRSTEEVPAGWHILKFANRFL